MPPHTLSIILTLHIHIIYLNKEKTPYSILIISGRKPDKNLQEGVLK